MCVISLGVNSPQPAEQPKALFQDFSRGLARIRKDLIRFNFRGDFIAWDQNYPEGSPTHQKIIYAFKPFCFLEAKKKGYQLVLWMDASIKIKQPIEPLFELMRDEGFVIFRGNHSVGEYCKDDALKPLGITREESFQLPSCWACVLGLDLSNQRAVEFLRSWKEMAADRVIFSGPKWSGVRGWPMTASKDPRVKGHRYDQTAASVIALHLGMDGWKSKEEFNQFFECDRAFVRQYHEYNNDRLFLKQIWNSGNRLIRKAASSLKGRFIKQENGR